MHQLTRLRAPQATWLSVLGLCAACMVGCADLSGERAVENHNFAQFSKEVYPVLLRDCGFPACHGDNERVFRVYGPGRTRLPINGEEPQPFDRASTVELRRTFQLALAHRDPENLEQSMLLRKPLSREAGGTTHQGVDKFGRDVYRTEQDPGYEAIVRWVISEDPAAADMGN